jgi:hypothetical protein
MLAAPSDQKSNIPNYGVIISVANRGVSRPMRFSRGAKTPQAIPQTAGMSLASRNGISLVSTNRTRRGFLFRKEIRGVGRGAVN